MKLPLQSFVTRCSAFEQGREIPAPGTYRVFGPSCWFHLVRWQEVKYRLNYCWIRLPCFHVRQHKCVPFEPMQVTQIAGFKAWYHFISKIIWKMKWRVIFLWKIWNKDAKRYIRNGGMLTPRSIAFKSAALKAYVHRQCSVCLMLSQANHLESAFFFSVKCMVLKAYSDPVTTIPSVKAALFKCVLHKY